ncbi:hypothetical protein [Enterobacter cloacae]|uniref:hypothetical protein n=1 Tax=Enterobacter cloacae TaxID=550 RepID=UPI001A16758C|nr:hypothetical protein [Enterobacter cloacae]
MTIDRILSIIATTVSFIAVPASGYLSYRYAIKGEKRKEFNAIADILRAKIRDQIRLVDDGYYPANGELEISDCEIDSLCDVSGKKSRDAIPRYWLAYKLALKESGNFNEFGEYDFHNPAPVRKSLQLLLSFTDRQ